MAYTGDKYFDDLKNAIVRQAVEDYAAAFMGSMVDKKFPEEMMEQCERFFHSGRYAELTNGVIDGDWLARNVKIRELEKVIEAYKTILYGDGTATFRVTVSFPYVKGRKKQKAVTYTFPPRLAKGILDYLWVQFGAVKEELKLLGGDVDEV